MQVLLSIFRFFCALALARVAPVSTPPHRSTVAPEARPFSPWGIYFR